jgi:hypothetical protein
MVPWPTTFATALEPARYFTAPPFELPISLVIAEPGWYAGHLHPDFLDLQRFDGVAVGSFPNRIVGFAWPASIRGVDGPVGAAGLTPAAAVDLASERSSVKTANRAGVQLLGLTGERIDLHSDLGSNPIFETSDGAFGLGPELDVRLAALPLDGRLLLVLVLAPPGQLDAAWDQAVPILASAKVAR